MSELAMMESAEHAELIPGLGTSSGGTIVRSSEKVRLFRKGVWIHVLLGSGEPLERLPEGTHACGMRSAPPSRHPSRLDKDGKPLPSAFPMCGATVVSTNHPDIPCGSIAQEQIEMLRVWTFGAELRHRGRHFLIPRDCIAWVVLTPDYLLVPVERIRSCEERP